MDEVRSLIDDCLQLDLLWLKTCEEGSEDYKKVLSDISVLHRMRMDEIRAVNEAELNRLRSQVEELKLKCNMESNRGKDCKNGQFKTDVFKTMVGFASDILKCFCSIKLSDQILRYEEGGIIRSKAFPLAQNLFKMK